MLTQLCPCGKPLHYANPLTATIVQQFIDELGEYVKVAWNGRTWLVSRHYIALHGLRARDLPQLGFEEITRVKAAVAHEREACALLAERLAICGLGGRDIAAAIRERAPENHEPDPQPR